MSETIHPKRKFFDAFNVKVDRLATQYADYHEENDIIILGDADPWGDTNRVTIETKAFPQKEILVIDERDEEDVVSELSNFFYGVDYNVKEFTEYVQRIYKYDPKNQ